MGHIQSSAHLFVLISLLLGGPPVPQRHILAKWRLELTGVMQRPYPLPCCLTAAAPFPQEVVAVDSSFALLRMQGMGRSIGSGASLCRR